MVVLQFVFVFVFALDQNGKEHRPKSCKLILVGSVSPRIQLKSTKLFGHLLKPWY